MNRRSLFKNLFALGVVTVLPLPVNALPSATAVPDEWDDFVARVRARVIEVVRREQRGIKKMWIEPARVDGARYTRLVHIELEPGPSLLDKLHFQFDEVSGSRWGGTDAQAHVHHDQRGSSGDCHIARPVQHEDRVPCWHTLAA